LENIVVVLKLAKYRTGRAAIGKSYIHHIHAVYDESKEIWYPQCPVGNMNIYGVVAYLCP
jgi:hypothetical protein